MNGRVMGVVVLGALFVLLAILLWAYRSGQLSSSADVRVDQNRVIMNFDELPSGTANQITRQYASYGIRFSGETATLGDWPLIAIGSGSLTAGTPTPSQPNSLVSSNRAENVYYPDASRPIVLVFVDPGDPTKDSTTDTVKFVLSANLNQWHSPAGDAGTVTVNAYGPDNTVVGSRTITTSGTQSIELFASKISRVSIEGAYQQNIFGRVIAPPLFAIDDLQFTMPASSVPGQLLVTTDQSEYAKGETVTLTYRNPSTRNVECKSPVGLTISGGGVGTATGAPGQVVYRQEAGTIADPLAPNTQRTVTWNQTANTGGASGQVAAGSYSAAVTCGTVTAAASFTIKEGQTPPPVIEPQATLTVDKSTYKPGETVTITLKNTGTVAFDCPTSAPFEIQDAEGKTVYQPIALQVIENVAAGASKSWTWNQKDLAEKQVKAGAYRVVVACGSVRKSAAFTIAADQPAPTPLPFGLEVKPTEGEAPLAVTGTLTLDTGKTAETLKPLLWDFGDGTTYPSAPTTQTHTYLKAGTYTVRLYAGDGRSTTSGPITVKAKSTPPVTTTTGGTGGGTTPTPPPSGSSATTPSAQPSQPGPTVSSAPANETKVSPATLVATGGNLWFNLLVALVLTSGVASLFLKKRSA